MKRLKSAISGIVLVMQCVFAFAQDIPEKPTPERLVNDLAGIIDEKYEYEMEKMLVDFNDTTSVQICVVTLPSLNGGEVAQVAYEIGQQWGVGQQGKDNGVVFLVTPKTESENGHAFISTGYGMEGYLPDAICTRIINETVIPYFKKNDYNNGILAGITYIMQYGSGQISPDEEDDDLYAVIAVTVICMIVLFSIAKSGYKSSGYSGSYGGSFGGGFSSGSFSSRGGSSFGGFGGGSFGGGGGGGSW